MSKISLEGNVSGSGTFTIASPNSNSNFTLTLPQATTTVVGTDATQTLTNKTLTTPNIDSAQFATVSGTAPLYACRAWVNFDGTGTPAIREDGNVSSITDNGTGDYTVNFTTAMPDANYSFGAICSSTVGASGYVARINSSGHVTSGSLRLTIVDPGVAISDALIVGVIVIR